MTVQQLARSGVHLSTRLIQRGAVRALPETVSALRYVRSMSELHEAVSDQLPFGADHAEPQVRVIRSSKRKKTSAARVVDGVIEVRIPSFLNAEREAEVVADLVRRVRKSLAVADTPIDLVERARTLAADYDLPQPEDIRWVTNQDSLWGSCTTGRGTIRISSRLARAPEWVVDYVVLHELTHLVEANHGPRFHELMRRYPRHDRAEGFLEAMSLRLADGSFLTD